MIEVKFLFDNHLISALENLIKESKHRLLIISPFIDLDNRIQDALREKQNNHDFKLHVLFGKNEDNLYKSIKKDSLNFLKKFPNIDIRYNERLHAKFYLNDFDFIMTSLNLYDYSLAKNIEVGITCNYATPGFIGKLTDSANNMIYQGVDKLKHEVIGIKKEINPIETFEYIFENSDKKYKTRPNVIDAGGLKSLIGGKKLDGFTIEYDYLLNISKEEISNKSELNDSSIKQTKPVRFEEKVQNGKLLSASQLSKLLGVPSSDITNIMQKSGLINGEVITNLGIAKGLVKKNYMGKDYIAYPENLDELKAIK